MSKNKKKNNKIEEIIIEEKEEKEEKEEEFEEEEENEENSFISSINIKNENNSNKKIFIIHLLIYSEIITNKGEDSSNCICRNYINKDKQNENFFENEIIPELKLPIHIENNKKKLYENNDNNNNNENNLNNQKENDNNYQIKLFDLCKNLKILGFPITGSMINIYDFMLNDYILYGCDPIDHNIYINNKNNILNNKIIKIKLINFIDKKLISGNINRNEELKELDEDDEDYDEDSDNSEIKIINNKDNNNNNNNNNNITRRRERRIGYVVEKVLAWRRLYNGFYNENGEHTKYDLEKAAKILGISKKSLDDYLLQIRLGRKYGFDFNKNRNNRVGVLRIFVRQKKNEELNKNKK